MIEMQRQGEPVDWDYEPVAPPSPIAVWRDKLANVVGTTRSLEEERLREAFWYFTKEELTEPIEVAVEYDIDYPINQ